MYSYFPIPMYLTSVLAALFGFWVLWNRPAEALNRLFFLVAFSVSWWAFGYGRVLSAQDADTALFWSRIGICGAILIPTFFYHFMLCFVRLPQRRFLRALYVGSALFLLSAHSPLFLHSPQHYFWGFYPRGGPLNAFFIAFFYSGFIVSLIDILGIYRKLKSHPEPYISVEQLRFVFCAYCVATCSASDYFANYGIAVYPFAYVAALGWLSLMAYAVLRYRLMDLRLILRKTLIYSFVSVALTVIYFLCASLLAGFSAAYFGSHSLMSAALISGFITVSFLPLFRWIQYVIDRLFFRFKIDRETRLMEFSSEIIQVDNLDSMTRSLYRVIEEALHPKSMALYLKLADKPDYVEVARSLAPHLPSALPVGNVWENYFRTDSSPVVREDLLVPEIREAMDRTKISAAVPLVSRQDILGFLLLGEKRSEEPYSNEDLVLLRIVLNQATIAYEKPKLIQEMTSGFAHEIKMPLANITLPAELSYIDATQALEGEQSAHEVLAKIQRRMKYIMDQAFLAGHRVDALQAMAGKDRSGFAAVPLNTVIQQTMKTLERLSVARQCTLSWQADASALVVEGDSRQLEIALGNILKNAIEAASAQPDGTASVVIRAFSTAGGAVIDVQDNGPGIAPDHQFSIFDAHFTTKGSEGQGMGLFLARQIARQHRGDLRLIPSSSGACFQLLLPLSA
jgi:signal transduction histidine kinase